jgi:hypothetical protein
MASTLAWSGGPATVASPQMPHIVGTRYALGRLGWVVAALAAIRVVLPLIVLAELGLPGVPPVRYDGLTGDATGYYAAVREVIAGWRGPPAVLVALLLIVVGSATVALAWAWRGLPGHRPWIVVAVAFVFALALCVPVAYMNPPGTGVVGWPLVWSLPLHPWRALGLPLGPDGAYAVAVVLSLAANAVSVVATAYAGLFATGRRTVAVGAAALLAIWPLLTGLVTGERGWENGTWAVDVGLAAYTEPLSTALVTVSLALLLSPWATDVRLAAAGVSLGLATTVKLSNGLLLGGALVLLAARVGLRRSLPFAAGGAAFVPLVAVYWPKGYPAVLDVDPDAWPSHPFALDRAVEAWTESLLFTPAMLLMLVPFAIVGAWRLGRGWRFQLLVYWSLLNPIVYSLYFITPLHPRVLFASLPAVFVLWVLGAMTVISAASKRLRSRAVAHGGSTAT